MTEQSGDRLPAVCILGLGIMGFAIAERLLDRGFALAGWNRSPGKTAPLAGKGMRIGRTAREAVAGAGIVTLCLTDERAMHEVMFGADGVSDVIAPNTIVVDFSTMGVASAEAFGKRLAAERGAAWIDAPVSGGPSGALAGKLAIFCGGEAEHIARAQPVLQALSRVCTHMGPLGAGQATKLCNQLIVSATMLAISEAITAGRALGLCAERLPSALAGGYADSIPLQIFGPRMAERACTPRISEVATMLKDVRLVAGSVADKPVELRLTRAVLALYEDAAARGMAGQDLGTLPILSERGLSENS